MKFSLSKGEFIFAQNRNFLSEDENVIFIEINDIDTCYIDKTSFNMQLTAEKKQIILNFEAKELLSCLNKNIINDLKENLKNEIENLQILKRNALKKTKFFLAGWFRWFDIPPCQFFFSLKTN